EGEGGTLGQYDDARRLIWLARRGDKTGLATARRELEEISKRRPEWAPISLCLGQISDLDGNEERALEHYLHAWEQGDRQMESAYRVVRLLYQRKRYADAEAVVVKLPKQAPLVADFRRMVADVFLQNGNFERALEAARKGAANSKDPRDFIWLGQVLWAQAQQLKP